MFTVRNVTIGEGKPKISVCLSSEDYTHLLNDISYVAHTDAEIIEWRADFYDGFLEDQKIFQALSLIRNAIGNKILLFSIRTKDEGGTISLKDDEYIHLFKFVTDTGLVDMIDVECCVSEYRSMEVIPYAKNRGLFVLGSNVSKEKMISETEMDFRIRYMQRVGADMVRLEVFPDRKSVTYKLLNDIYSITHTLDFPVSIMAGGKEGKYVKVLSEFFGNAVVFTESKSNGNDELDVNKASLLINELHNM